MDSKRVFILGAGFSKQAGMPLATRLTEFLTKDFDIPGNNFLRAWYEDFRDRVIWLNRSSSQGHSSLNVEELFDLASYDILVYRMKAMSSPSTACALYSEYAGEIKHALDQMEADLWNVIIEKQNEGAHNLDRITKFSAQLRSADTVITFNYDTLLEYSLLCQNTDWHYGFNEECDKGIPVLKMHGSVNWLKVPDGAPMPDEGRYKRLFRSRAEQESVNGGEQAGTPPYDLLCHHDCSPPNLCDNTRFRYEPSADQRALAGLGRYKPLDELPGSWKVWAKAIGNLKRADEIYVIGFSLSPFDSMARLHFAGVMCERAKKQDMPKRVVLIDPYACELLDNFRSVFGPDVQIESIQKLAEEVDWNSLLDQ